MASSIYQATPNGHLQLRLHPGQYRAWQSEKRFVVVLSGTQGGKTSFGPLWLYREMQRGGPGDYLVVTPVFPLLELKALPEFKRYFIDTLHLGEYRGSPARVFRLSEEGARRTFGAAYDPTIETRVLFGYALEPESLESSTMKAAWLDEAGQRRFRLGAWEAILRRLSLAQGRALLTTTPYDLGWLKQRIWDRWKAGDPDIDVIRFDSTENPAFPRAEFERARRDLPPWKFDLFYRAVFSRPAGMIYDSFDPVAHTSPRFVIPGLWPRYLGLDFGGVHTAGLFYAAEPGTNRLWLYREYLAGGRSAAEHAAALLAGEPGIPECVGGSRSEGQWRREFAAGGLPIRPPAFSDVEVGINRVYGAHKRAEIRVFDDLAGYLEQKQTYSRVLDETGEPTEAIEDKNLFHFLDAERYIIAALRGDDAVGSLDDDVADALSDYRGW
jgi:hypothetical protein